MTQNELIIKNKKSIVNLGSTYAKYAFGTYKELGIDGANLACSPQSLSGDEKILKRNIKSIKEGGYVIIPIAPCLFLYNKINNPHGQTSYLKAMHLLISNPTLVKRILFDDDFRYYSIYESRQNYQFKESSLQSLLALEKIWLSIFCLNNLQDNCFNDKNINSISKNKTSLLRIIKLCVSNNLKPVIVILPFSHLLMKRFSDDFLNTAMYSPLKEITDLTGAHLIDYYKEGLFLDKPEMFVDGGFCLNMRGSKIFLKRIKEDLKLYESRTTKCQN